MADDSANENSEGWLKVDPDTWYVEDYLAKMLAHFADRKIHFATIAREMTGALIKLAPGKPYEKEPDAADLRAGLSMLSPAAHTLQTRAEAYERAYDKALHRLHLKRLEGLAAKHNCSIEEAHAIWVAIQQDSQDMTSPTDHY